MKIELLLFAASIATALITPTTLRAGILAGPVVNPANGHRYFLLTTNTWTAARDEAATVAGTGGVLTTNLPLGPGLRKFFRLQSSN